MEGPPTGPARMLRGSELYSRNTSNSNSHTNTKNENGIKDHSSTKVSNTWTLDVLPSCDLVLGHIPKRQGDTSRVEGVCMVAVLLRLLLKEGNLCNLRYLGCEGV